MRTLCIYHRIDLDGWASAAIVVKKFKEDSKNEGKIASIVDYQYKDDVMRSQDANMLDMLGYNYGDPILVDFSLYDKVILVDISLYDKNKTVNPMIDLYNKLGDNFIYIDHHISAFNDIKNAMNGEIPFNGNQSIKYAACELAWTFFYPEQEIPKIINYLGLYDTFRHKNIDTEYDVLKFQYGARSYINNYIDASYYIFNDTYFDEISDAGNHIYNYLLKESEIIYKNKFDKEINGYNFICFNQPRFNPSNFEIDYINKGYDGAVSFYYDGESWNFSIYSENVVDCSIIAKQFGGGGHKGAAGFRLKNIDDFFNL